MPSPLQPLRDALTDAGEDDYDRLPSPIQQSTTRAEFLWLSDSEKQTLVEKECEPEW